MLPWGFPGLLGPEEDLVPQPGLEVTLQLGQVEVGPAAPLQEAPGVVGRRAGRSRTGWPRRVARPGGASPAGASPGGGRGGWPPAPWRRYTRPSSCSREMVRSMASVRLSCPSRRFSQVGERVLEVGHEGPGPRVEGVDHHLAVDRPGDLHPPVLESAGTGATRQSLSRTARVSARKSGRTPASSSRWRSARRCRSATRRRRTPAAGGPRRPGHPRSGPRRSRRPPARGPRRPHPSRRQPWCPPPAGAYLRVRGPRRSTVRSLYCAPSSESLAGSP